MCVITVRVVEIDGHVIQRSTQSTTAIGTHKTHVQNMATETESEYPLIASVWKRITSLTLSKLYHSLLKFPILNGKRNLWEAKQAGNLIC